MQATWGFEKDIIALKNQEADLLEWELLVFYDMAFLYVCQCYYTFINFFLPKWKYKKHLCKIITKLLLHLILSCNLFKLAFSQTKESGPSSLHWTFSLLFLFIFVQ